MSTLMPFDLPPESSSAAFVELLPPGEFGLDAQLAFANVVRITAMQIILLSEQKLRRMSPKMRSFVWGLWNVIWLITVESTSSTSQLPVTTMTL